MHVRYAVCVLRVVMIRRMCMRLRHRLQDAMRLCPYVCLCALMCVCVRLYMYMYMYVCVGSVFLCVRFVLCHAPNILFVILSYYLCYRAMLQQITTSPYIIDQLPLRWEAWRIQGYYEEEAIIPDNSYNSQI